MAVNLQGQIVDEQGTVTSDSTVNLDTGELLGSKNLSNTDSGLDLPSISQTQPQELLGASQAPINVLEQQIQSLLGQESEAAGTQEDIMTNILSSLQTTQGRDSAQLTAEEQAGLPTQRKELQEMVGRLQQLRSEAMAIPLQIQEEFTGRGATRGGVEPIQTSRLRQNAIQSLTIGAQAQALQGNIALAQQQVNRAVDLQFKPIEDRLEFLQTAYTLNKDVLEREDKKRAQQLEIALQERSRLITEQKEERKAVGNILTTISQFPDVPQSVKEAVANSRTLNEAVLAAGPYMQDPAAKQALLNAKADYDLKRVQIAQKQAELDIYRQYGGLSPTEWLKQQKEQNDGSDPAQLFELNNNIDQVDAILNGSGLSTVVGPTGLARSRGGFAERFVTGATAGAVGGVPLGPIGIAAGAVAGGLGLGLGAGAFQEITGSADNTVGLTEQLLSQGFLDKLISSKGQGATFGQLSDREGAALRSAATAISQTAIRDKNDKVIGYDMSEAEFRKQMGIIRERIQFARNKWTNDSFSSDEQAQLDSIFDSSGTSLQNPGSYFQ